jgi:uncharacterized protein (DUF779 family)
LVAELADAPSQVRDARGSMELFRDGAFVIGPDDRFLGMVAGTAFYIDADQHEPWNRPLLVLDVADGAATGFSLEGLAGIHFLTRSAASRCHRRER